MRPLRGLPAEVRALVGVAFMVALGYGLVAPALPLFARQLDRKSTRLNSSHYSRSRMPSSA